MFTTQWSQKGPHVYLVFEKTSDSFQIEDVAVTLTNTSCKLTIPDCLPFGFELFDEIDQKRSERQQNNDRLVLVLRKKNENIKWTSLTSKNVNEQNNEYNQRAVTSVRMSGGTIVTHGILKGGNQTSASSPCQTGQDIMKEGFKSLKQFEHESHQLKTVKHAWYETGSHSLVITIYIALLDQLGVSVIYEERNLTITMKTCDETFHEKYGTTIETPFLWSIRLFAAIVPSKGRHKITRKTLEIHLLKQEAVKWKNLLEIETPSLSLNSTENRKDGWKKIGQDEPMEFASDDEDNNNVKKNENRPLPSTTSCFHSRTSVKSVCRAGFTGLNNLGNTCFMNSVLQALANTSDLKTYLLDGHYRKDINTKNPLGMKGKMVEVVFELFKELWSRDKTSFSPIKFKEMVGLKEPRFTDYMQHDAQEFMAFLLDIIHEDVNRVVEKPYSEGKEDDDRPDHVVAEESWKLHKSRNDSFIVDLFHGLFKSKLDCPKCGHCSLKFDPFLFLTIPLPKPKRVLSVFFHYVDPTRKPVKITLSVSSSGGTMLEIFQKVGEKMNISVNKLQIFEVYKQWIRRFFLPTSSLNDVRPDDVIFVQETQAKDEDGNEMLQLPVVQRQTVSTLAQHCAYCSALPQVHKLKRCLKCMRVGYCHQVCQRADWPQHRKNCSRKLDVVGMPFFMCFPKRKATYKYLCELVTMFSKRSVKVTHYQQTNATPPSPVEGCPFVLSPVNWKTMQFNTLPPLTDQGDEVLDLSDCKLLGLDWETDNRKTYFVKVESVTMDCDEISVAGENNNGADIRSCLQLFTEPEILSQMEAWYCPRCKDHREATKKMSIWQLPKVLILQLKRFSFKNLLWRDKIDTFVDFPVNGLDMSEFCINPRESNIPQIYDLYAVVNHHGGIFGGHYTSYVRLATDDDSSQGVGWRFCDDSHIRELNDPQQVVSKAAYVVMYKKRKLPQAHPSLDQRFLDHPAIEEERISGNPPSPTAPFESPSPSRASPSPSSNSQADDPLEADEAPYYLSSVCLGTGRNTSNEPEAVDDISGVPLIRYNEIFDDQGNVREETDSKVEENEDNKDHGDNATMIPPNSPVSCKEDFSKVNCNPPLSYTDMDAID
uniref:ubiquitinyl hydrolase 1 n=1 Tax=Phallusia mammillata TaxID=59560 RepID=A0A6F9DVR3_9ASCI|nr:ZF(MYND)-3 zinc finger protein [Phallusia mammillata]